MSTAVEAGDLLSILAPDGTVDAALDPGLGADLLLRMYRAMVSVRVMDERLMTLQRQGRIFFYLASTGQEACSIGTMAPLAEEDWVVPGYRQPGAFLYRGVTAKQIVAQCFGNAWDNTKGRQMPVHYSFRAQNMVSISSPIGTQLIQAAGVAMAMRRRGDKRVAITFIGDGGTSSNDFHAGMNFAAVDKAPCILVCENNGFAISCPTAKQTASETFVQKAVAYGMPGVRVDGNDVLAVYQVTKDAAARARAGEGPTFVEAVTYRRLGHSSSDDPSRYRDESEVAAWEKRDPVERLRRHLESRGAWDADHEQQLQDRIANEVNAAIREAEAAGPVAPDTLVTDVFADVTPQLEEQLREALGD